MGQESGQEYNKLLAFTVFLKGSFNHRLRARLSRWRGGRAFGSQSPVQAAHDKKHFSVNEQLLEVYSNTFYLTVAGFPGIGTAKHFSNRKGKTFLGHPLKR